MVTAESAPAPEPSRKLIRFKVDKEHVRRIEVEPGVSVYHIYPTLASWLGREVPDDVNPRSHEVVSGSVPKAIASTIKNNPSDFYLANRGGTVLAKLLKFDPDRQEAEITLEDTTGDSAREGMADGATTDAVIAQVQAEVAADLGAQAFRDLTPEQVPPMFHQARYHLEVIVGLDDMDRILNLVKGRNTSKQVATWSLADWGGSFNWIKDVLERPGGTFKGKIGYDENAPADVDIREILAILTLFHRSYDSKGRAPTVAYTSRGRMDQRLQDDEAGYKSLTSILEDILRLHDYVYARFHTVYKAARPGGKLGRRGEKNGRIFPKNPKTLPLTGDKAEYVVPNGVLYPFLAALRALVEYDANGNARWKLDPQAFFDKNGPELMENLIEQLEVVGNNPQTMGKTKTVYTALYNQARLLLADQSLGSTC